MSASLVGSEMCIRDRSSLAEAARAHSAIFDHSRALIRSSGAADFGGFSAVSYTHLTLPTICSV
eukprot:2703490-Alexandrium_andersonii.AAC.1